MADFNLDLDSFDFGDFDSLDTGIDVPVASPSTPSVIFTAFTVPTMAKIERRI